MEPQPDAVLRVAEKFRDSRYDIKVALRALLLEEAFWSEQNRGALIKSPIDLVVGTVRQFAIAVPDTMPLALITSQLGQRLFAPPNVKGWPGGEAWINASSLLARKQFLEQVFRSGERPITPPRDLPMMRGAAQFDRERLARTYHSIMFDPRQWMTELRAVSAGSPLPFILAPTRDGSMENTPENSTSGGIDGMTDDAHRATRAMDPIRAWVLDARYQLK